MMTKEKRKIELIENGANCVLLKICYEDTYTSVRLTNLELHSIVSEGAKITKKRIENGLMDIENVLRDIKKA